MGDGAGRAARFERDGSTLRFGRAGSRTAVSICSPRIIRVDLEVEGQVSVGPNGHIRGEVVTDDLVVGGKVEDKVLARKHLHVASSGSVRGEVRYGTLQVDRGAVMDGSALFGDNDAEKTASEPPVAARPPQLPARMGAS